MVNSPAPFFVIRLKPREGTAWGMAFVINERGEWQKMAGQGWQFPIKYLIKKFVMLTTGMVNCPAPFLGCYIEAVRRHGMGCLILGGGRWQKMAGQGWLNS